MTTPPVRMVLVDCQCGQHLVCMDQLVGDTAFYHCNKCSKPLVVKGEDGKVYLVGDEIDFD